MLTWIRWLFAIRPPFGYSLTVHALVFSTLWNIELEPLVLKLVFVEIAS
jgi:hypothetical protein